MRFLPRVRDARMIQIRFREAGSERVVNIPTAEVGRRTILDVARSHGIPVLFNCEAGACGACLVRVEADISVSGDATLGEDERFLLEALGVLNDVAVPSPGRRVRYRLACQVLATRGDLCVTLP